MNLHWTLAAICVCIQEHWRRGGLKTEPPAAMEAGSDWAWNLVQDRGRKASTGLWLFGAEGEKRVKSTMNFGKWPSNPWTSDNSILQVCCLSDTNASYVPFMRWDGLGLAPPVQGGGPGSGEPGRTALIDLHSLSRLSPRMDKSRPCHSSLTLGFCLRSLSQVLVLGQNLPDWDRTCQSILGPSVAF